MSSGGDPIQLAPIGLVRSPSHSLAGMPLQSVAASDIEGVIELCPERAPGLRDLDGFSHLHLISWLHPGEARRAARARSLPRPQDARHLRDAFSCRTSLDSSRRVVAAIRAATSGIREINESRSRAKGHAND